MLISASRRTDIPQFYFTDFIKSIKRGYINVPNPFNPAQISNISLRKEDVDCIVFWTKNPQPAIEHLKHLKEYMYYFLFTLNSYGRDLEPSSLSIEEKISIFSDLSRILGRERVIWRYDPVIFSDFYNFEYHLRFFKFICSKLSGLTDKCIFSFLDFYFKIKRKIQSFKIYDPDFEIKERLAAEMKIISDAFGIELCACCEDKLPDRIMPSSCIDGKLINTLTGGKLPCKKDLGQRKACHCAKSRDIGIYRTCRAGCVYCYAM